MKKLLAKGRASGFFTLVAGTGVAQAIPIAFAPILTRLYTPEDFGAAALYLSLASILGVVATLRYEAAILQPRDDKNAYQLVRLCVCVAAIMALILTVSLLFWADVFAAWLGNESLGALLFLLPLGMVLTAVFQAYSYWSIRTSTYGSVAIANTVQATVTPSSQLIFSSFAKVWGVGLVVGNVVGQAVASFFLFLRNRTALMTMSASKTEGNSLLGMASKYKRMPLFGLPGALLDTTAVQLPILIMTKAFDSTAVGFFSLVFRVLSIPARLLSGVLSQLLLKRLSRIANSTVAGQTALPLIVKTSICLMLCIAPLVIIMQLWGEELFVFVFGHDWRAAGGMAVVLVYAVAIRFSVSPLSSVLALDQHMRKGFCWQLLYFVTLASTLLWASSKSLEDFLFWFVVHEVLLYLIYLGVIIWAGYQMDKKVN